MNVKGTSFFPLVYVLILLFLASAIALSIASRPTENLGSAQAELVYAKQKVVEAQIGMDVLAKDVALDSLYTLARNGGYHLFPACGDYFGLSLWSARNPEKTYSTCVPQLYEEISEQIESDLSTQITTYPNKYEVFVNGSLDVYGVALEPYIYGIGSKRSYAERLGFTLEYDYDFRQYQTISDFLTVVSRECSGKENTLEKKDLDTCVLIVSGRYGIDVLDPLYFSNTEESYAKNSFQEMLRVMQGTTYTQCFHSFEPVEAQETLYDVYAFDEVSLGDGISITINDGISTPIPRMPLPKSIFYEPSKKILEVDGFSFGLNQLNFYTYADNSWVFFERADDSYVEANREYTPCLYENRNYLFRMIKEAFYPGEENIEYFFSAYIKDEVAPDISALAVLDKPFDEDSLIIRWKNSESLDIDHFELYLDGEKIDEIRPWKDVLVHDSIDWNYGQDLPFCRLESEGGFMKCVYAIDGSERVLNEGLYYFLDSKEFVYVTSASDGFHEVMLKVVDDDLNVLTLESVGESIDDLPYEALTYTLSETPNPSQPEFIQTITVAITPPVFNLDGSVANDVPIAYLFYQDPDLKHIYQPVGLIDIVTPAPPELLGASLNMLVVAEDEALDNLDLSLEEMGYTTPGLQ